MENRKLNIYRGEYYDLFINRYFEYCKDKRKNIIKKGKKVNTHNIRELLKYCKEKKDIFRDGCFEALVKAFDDFNEIRYPSRLCIDKQIIYPIDKFVKTVRNLIDPNIADTISDLLSGGIADTEMRHENDLFRSFIHENKQFEPRKH